MKAISVHRPGGPEVLEIEQMPLPEPRAGLAGRYQVNGIRTFHFEDIVEAHRFMESNHASGKLVVTVEPRN